MCRQKFTRYRQITANALAFLMLAVLLFSSVFVAAEAHHDCPGEDCPVCLNLRMCEEILRTAGSRTAVQAAVIPLLIVLLTSFLFTQNLPQETPVSRKVRLND